MRLGQSQQSADPLARLRALIAEGKLTQADSSLRSYVEGHPSSADAHFLLGYVLFREQKAIESLAEFTAGAKVRRPSAEDLKTVASDYVSIGDFGDADKWFTEVTKEIPKDADAWYLLGRTKYNENLFAEAASCFNHALSLHPKYVEAENNLGLTLVELNKPDEAKAAYESAIEWQGAAPTDPQPFLNLGTMFADQGDAQQALPNLLKAESLAPANPKIHEELGQVYETQKDLPKAQAELEKSVELAPDSSGLHFKLGQIYRHEGLRDRAQQQFDLCAKLNSTHSSTATPNTVKAGQGGPH
jgi:tetratricopeptide (TPR) repeat protein